MNITWNAENYRDNFSFVPQYGTGVMDLLTVPAGSFVVDLGCGNGALTAKLAERGYRVLGLDASPEMIALAKKTYPELPFMLADACDFSLSEKADAIFSNAVFHWIDDQDALLQSISDNLKPGGELVFEFGGKGNAAQVHNKLHDLFTERGLSYPMSFNFFDIAEYAPRMQAHGLKVCSAFLFDRPTPQSGEHGLIDWVRMFLKRSFERLDDALAEEILCRMEQELRGELYKDGTWFVDYVRLRMRGIKI